MNIAKGKIVLNVFGDANYLGPNASKIGIYQSYNDAADHINIIAEFTVSDLGRWLMLECTLEDLDNLYLRIDNQDAVGDFYILPQVLSYGLYY